MMNSVPVLLRECPDLIKSVEDLDDPRVIEQVIAGRIKRFAEETDSDNYVRRGDVYDEPDPSKPLPEGYVLAPFVYSGYLGGITVYEGPPVIAVRMACLNCNKHGTHWSKDCPLKNSNIRHVRSTQVQGGGGCMSLVYTDWCRRRL